MRPGRGTILQNASGFTLMELLIGIAIVGILGSIAYLGSGFLDKYRLNAASRELLADLQWARQQAVTRRTESDCLGFGIRFEDTGTYHLFEFQDCNGDFGYDADGCSGDREEKVVASKSLPRNGVCQISSGGSLVSPANEILLFDTHGLSRSVTWGSVSGRTYVLSLKDVSPPRCISVSKVRIREGLWYDKDGDSTLECNNR